VIDSFCGLFSFFLSFLYEWFGSTCTERRRCQCLDSTSSLGRVCPIWVLLSQHFQSYSLVSLCRRIPTVIYEQISAKPFTKPSEQRSLQRSMNQLASNGPNRASAVHVFPIVVCLYLIESILVMTLLPATQRCSHSRVYWLPRRDIRHGISRPRLPIHRMVYSRRVPELSGVWTWATRAAGP
jgi:hypothetical protein